MTRAGNEVEAFADSYDFNKLIAAERSMTVHVEHAQSRVRQQFVDHLRGRAEYLGSRCAVLDRHERLVAFERRLSAAEHRLLSTFDVDLDE